MIKKDRGFKQLVGVTIKAVDALQADKVILLGDDDRIYTISAEPELKLTCAKQVKYKVPETKLVPKKPPPKVKKWDLWPYPPEKD